MTAPLSAGLYAFHAVRRGVDYYVAGRFSATAQLVPVAGNLLHHAVEMILKGCIVNKRGFDGLHHGHELPKLWRAFKRVFSSVDLKQLDGVITSLHKFDHIRYPDDMMREGAILTFQFEASTVEPDHGGTPHYPLVIDEIDTLIFTIMKVGDFNAPGFFNSLHPEHATKYLAHRNKHPLSLSLPQSSVTFLLSSNEETPPD